MGTVDFEGDLADPVAVLTQFGLDRVAALRPLVVLAFKLLHLLGAMLHLLGEGVELGVKFGTLLFDRGELAGQNQTQLGPHFFPQPGIALRLRGLPLQRIHLPRDFVEDVVHARQVQLGVFQSRFGEPLLGLELRNAGSLFQNRAAIGRAAAQDLPDASLLDRARRTQARGPSP